MTEDIIEKLTPTEKRLYQVLVDGEKHLKEELRRAIDEYATVRDVRKHIMNIRTKLPSGVLILCELKGHAIYYRLVYRFYPVYSPTTEAV